MSEETSTQPGPRKRRFILWFAWGGLLLLGGALVSTLVATVVTLAKDGTDSRKLPFLLFIVVFVVLFFVVKAATHPIRGRADESKAWRERFPNQSDREFEDFLRVVGDSLGIREKHRWRLLPDDRVRALSQEWLCGDGMEIIGLLMAIEQEYGLDLPDTLQEATTTLGDLFALVSQRGSRRSPSAVSGFPDPTG